jgi:hypothetical protein
MATRARKALNAPPAPANIRHLRQTNRTSGCGPACVAMVADVAEQEAIQAMFGDFRSTNLWSRWTHLQRALRGLGVRIGSRPYRTLTWAEVPSLSIVGIGKRSRPDRIAHWVVYDPASGTLYDPLRPAPISISRMRRQPLAYLRIKMDRDRPDQVGRETPPATPRSPE